MGLDTVELIMSIEEEFELSISDEAAARIETVGQLYDCVCAESPYLRGRVSPGAYEGPAWDRLVQVIVESSGVAQSRVRPEARIVHDLGIN